MLLCCCYAPSSSLMIWSLSCLISSLCRRICWLFSSTWRVNSLMRALSSLPKAAVELNWACCWSLRLCIMNGVVSPLLRVALIPLGLSLEESGRESMPSWGLERVLSSSRRLSDIYFFSCDISISSSAYCFLFFSISVLSFLTSSLIEFNSTSSYVFSLVLFLISFYVRVSFLMVLTLSVAMDLSMYLSYLSSSSSASGSFLPFPRSW